MPRQKRSLAERFWAKVDKTSHPGGCWEWTGSRLKRGYGHLKVDDRTELAHTVVLQLIGRPLAKGMQGCHSCDNPPCVNPAHLFEGTQTDNMRDMVAKSRHRFAGKTHCPHGHPLSGENVYVHGGRRQCRQCRRERNRRASRAA